MSVLGIDPAVNTGFVVLDEGEVAYSTVFKNPTNPKKYKFHTERWFPYMDTLRMILINHKPDMVVIEGYGFASHSLGISVAIGTLLRYTVVKHSPATLIEVAPGSLKKFITGKGNAKKDSIMLEVYKRWGFDAKSNDEADAYALAKLGEALMGRDPELPKINMTALDKVRQSSGYELTN